MIEQSRWSSSREKWHLGYFNRYFSAYFENKKLDEITEEFAQRYWSWRRRYWNDGAGEKQIAYNRRRKRAKSYTTHNAKKTPALKTLKMEQSALNQFFEWCYSTKRFMRFSLPLKVNAELREQGEGRRASFDNDEWRVLTPNLRHWANVQGKFATDRVNEWHRHQRQQLRCYVLFLANTGIRSGTETRFMRWEDIKEIEVEQSEPGKQQTILDIKIRTTGKTRKTRHVMLACTRFRRHRVRCFNGTGGVSWRGGSLHESSSLRRCG